MTKPKVAYQCNVCGASQLKWGGQCGECRAWNTLIEVVIPAAPRDRPLRADTVASEVSVLSAVTMLDEVRIATGLNELDRAVGGGLVSGSVSLIGGAPGIGKSTLLLQVLSRIGEAEVPVLYVSGEESAQQIGLRGHRLGLALDVIKLQTENHLETILAVAEKEQPSVMAIDSIQTVYTDLLSSAPGAVAQVRESAAKLARFAKHSGITMLLVGHVTKDGALAGPRVLEHIVDTVLYFEGDPGSRYRVIRAIKNRYGAANELGVFAMTDRGLKEVGNPSAIFLSRHEEKIAGSVIMATWEGTRPLLIEVQALVDESSLGNPRRVSVGLEQNRLSMLLAILHRHAGVNTADRDVFINVVGGIKITETAADLAIILAAISSLRDMPLSRDLVVFGEIGLAGEIRPVQGGQERLQEAVKHGFKRAIIPQANRPKQPIKGLDVLAVSRLSEAIAELS